MMFHSAQAVRIGIVLSLAVPSLSTTYHLRSRFQRMLAPQVHKIL